MKLNMSADIQSVDICYSLKKSKQALKQAFDVAFLALSTSGKDLILNFQRSFWSSAGSLSALAF